MANLYKRQFTIKEPEIIISFSESLSQIINIQLFDKMIKQIKKLPKPIPKIRNFYTNNIKLDNAGFAKIQMVRDLKDDTENTGYFRVHVAYEPGESYSLRNTVGRVFGLPSGLILLNDVRLKQVAGNPIDPTYLVNLILHELLHIYGIDHASGLPFNEVKNTPVMNAGKFGKLGLSQDDIAGLRERYEVKPGKRVCLTVNASPGRIGLVNIEKNARSQGKLVMEGKAIFPQLHKGKYHVYHNDVKVKTVTVNKDKEITL